MNYQHFQQPRYCVDGHDTEDEDSPFQGNGQYPPFVVFDIVAQDNLPGTYRTRNEAEVVVDLLNRRA